jgi:small subunit ribosomal protein S6
MPIYETVFIARQELGAAQVEELTNQYTKILTDNGGKILKTESWGLRTLAYKIRKNRKGHYVLIESDTPSAALLECERNMGLNEDVLRFLSVRLEEPSKGQSKILDKSRDDEEGGRGDRDGFRSRDRGDRPDRGDRGDRGDREPRGGQDFNRNEGNRSRGEAA